MKGKDQEGLPNSVSASQLAGGGPVKSVHRLRADENLPALPGPRAVTDALQCRGQAAITPVSCTPRASLEVGQDRTYVEK